MKSQTTVKQPKLKFANPKTVAKKEMKPYKVSQTKQLQNSKFAGSKSASPRKHVSRKSYVLNLKLHDPLPDLFSNYCEFPIQLEHYDSQDPVEALRIKKSQRQQQMNTRRIRRESGLTGISPNIERGRESIHQQYEDEMTKKAEKQPVQKVKAQVPKDQRQSPFRATESFDSNNSTSKIRMKGRMKSLDNNQAAIYGGQKIQLSLSSGKRELENDSNSIISEEDSAFEEASPKGNNKTKTKRKEVLEQVVEVKRNTPKKMMGPQPNSKNTAVVSVNVVPLSNESFKMNRPVLKHMTLDKTSVPNFPYKRSTTQKLRDKEQQLLRKSKASNTRSKFKNEPFEKQSRNSSLNLQSDHNIDQLSVNIGQLGFSNRKFLMPNSSRKNRNNNDSGYDSMSVVSVITGTKRPIFSKVSGRQGEESILPFKKQETYQSTMNRHKDDEVIAESKEINYDHGSRSRSNSMQKRGNNREKIQSVYLQTPFKVKKFHNDYKRNAYTNEKGLFRAENNLDVHTVLRGRLQKNLPNTQATKVDFKVLMNNTGPSTDRIKITDRSNKFFNSTSNAQMFGQKRLSKSPRPVKEENLINSQMLLTCSSLLENETYTQALSQLERKELKQRKHQLEQDLKRTFYEQLTSQIDKKIEQVSYQNKHLKKQNQLFNIYGKSTFSSLPSHQYSMPIDVPFQSGQIELQETNYKTNVNMSASRMENRDSGTISNSPIKIKYDTVKKEMIKINPYLPVKGRTKAVQEIKAAIYVPNQNLSRTQEFNLNQNSEDFAKFKSMIDLSQSIGLTKLQLNQLKQKKNALEEAEKILGENMVQVQTQTQNFKLDSTTMEMKLDENSKAHFVNKGNFESPVLVKRMKPDIKLNRLKTIEITSDKASELGAGLKQIQARNLQFNGTGKFKNSAYFSPQKQTDNYVNMRSTEFKDEVNDYYDNKMELKRTIDASNVKQYELVHRKFKVSQKPSNNQGKQTMREIQYDQQVSKSNVKIRHKNFVQNNINNTVLPQIKNPLNMQVMEKEKLRDIVASPANTVSQYPIIHQNKGSNSYLVTAPETTNQAENTPIRKTSSFNQRTGETNLKGKQDSIGMPNEPKIMAYSNPAYDTVGGVGSKNPIRGKPRHTRNKTKVITDYETLKIKIGSGSKQGANLKNVFEQKQKMNKMLTGVGIQYPNTSLKERGTRSQLPLISNTRGAHGGDEQSPVNFAPAQ